MEPLVERLLVEQTELNEKLEKLQAFQNSDKFNSIHPTQMLLLDIQAKAMATYAQCLTARISHFGLTINEDDPY